jgi:hypothetical protein
MVSVSEFTEEQLLSHSRKIPLCLMRFIIYHTLHAEGWSSPKIGEEFDMNHASVLHGIRKIQDFLSCRTAFKPYDEIYDKFIQAITPMKKKIYISLPISGRDAEERREYAEKIKAHINKTMPSFEVVNPLENKLDFNVHWSRHMKVDIQMLLECNAIYMCEDWQWSHGCKLEHDIATSCGLDVFYQESVWHSPVNREQNGQA